jgi:hypothetical protein
MPLNLGIPRPAHIGCGPINAQRIRAALDPDPLPPGDEWKPSSGDWCGRTLPGGRRHEVRTDRRRGRIVRPVEEYATVQE